MKNFFSFIRLSILSILSLLFALFLHSQPATLAQASQSFSLAQTGRILEDRFNADNTTTIQSLAACLPSHLSHAQATQFGILSFAEGTRQDGAPTRYFYIETSYIPTSSKAAVPLPWFTLIDQASDGSCQNHIPRSTSVTLSVFVPVDTAVQFLAARYNLIRQTDPQRFESMARYYSTGIVDYNQPDAPMDDPYGCQLYPEEKLALSRVGITVSDSCQLLPPPQ